MAIVKPDQSSEAAVKPEPRLTRAQGRLLKSILAAFTGPAAFFERPAWLPLPS